VTDPQPRLREVSDYHPLEVASGFLRGQEPIGPLQAEPAVSARSALELAVLSALQRPPCVVSFSGGRDSSTVLAVAAHVAAKEGLPPPLPVTLRFPKDAGSQESEWQELVVRHLGLPAWERRLFDEELEVVGPYADAVLRRHGLLYPLNTHFHAPILEHARGGSLLTGIGGDEVLSATRYRRLNSVMHGSESPRPRDVLSIVGAYGPAWIRRLALSRHDEYWLPWLTPSANHELRRWRTHIGASAEVRWDRWVARVWWQDRGRVMGERSIAAIAAEQQALAVHPLTHPTFLATAARERGAIGFPSRREALDALAGDLLPAGFSARKTKASFNHSFFGSGSRKLAEAWDGTGFDPGVVDADGLRRAWREPLVDGRSKWLLQVLHLRRLRALEGPHEGGNGVVGR
jgi:asparagine synthetase B (glutamine-hydrolysing)